MKEQLERDIIRYVVVVTVLYLSYVTFISLFPVFVPANAGIASALGIVLTVLLFQNQRGKSIEWIAFTLHVCILGAMLFFWVHFGGLAGAVPSILCIYIAFIVMASSGWSRTVALGAVALTLVALFAWPGWFGMEAYSAPGQTSGSQLWIDYVITGGFFFAFVYYFKNKFTYYRERVRKSHRQLNESANLLYEQNQELATREEETRALNDNLEALVDERAELMEKKNLELAEYAFINAHMLRGPLCRVMGLLSLMEKEPHLYPAEQVAHARAVAHAIDQQIREINRVVS